MPRNFSSWQCVKVCDLVLVASACAGPAGAAFTYVGSIGWHPTTSARVAPRRTGGLV